MEAAPAGCRRAVARTLMAEASTTIRFKHKYKDEVEPALRKESPRTARVVDTLFP